MLIIALVLAVIGLAALVTAVVTSNELIAWVCIGASVVGVLLLIVDAVRERSQRDDAGSGTIADVEDEPGYDSDTEQFDADYPEDAVADPEPESDSDTADPATDADADADGDAVPFDERHEDRPTS